MTEAEVLEKLATYKDAIIKLKTQRDELKQKVEALENSDQSRLDFMSKLSTAIEDINTELSVN